ncbi:23737_t:CDS:2, partial [Gigaspora rosea]
MALTLITSNEPRSRKFNIPYLERHKKPPILDELMHVASTSLIGTPNSGYFIPRTPATLHLMSPYENHLIQMNTNLQDVNFRNAKPRNSPSYLNVAAPHHKKQWKDKDKKTHHKKDKAITIVQDAASPKKSQEIVSKQKDNGCIELDDSVCD